MTTMNTAKRINTSAPTTAPSTYTATGRELDGDDEEEEDEEVVLHCVRSSCCAVSNREYLLLVSNLHVISMT